MISNKELLEIYKLKNIIRYNTHPKLTKESVAEHSFYVALIALKICDKLNVNEDIKLLSIEKALLHDLPEIKMNDITYDAKHMLHLEEIIKNFETKYYEENYPKYTELMNTKDGLVSSIVSLSDILSVKQFSLFETLLGNNSPEMKQIENDTDERITEITKKLYEELKK